MTKLIHSRHALQFTCSASTMSSAPVFCWPRKICVDARRCDGQTFGTPEVSVLAGFGFSYSTVRHINTSENDPRKERQGLLHLRIFFDGFLPARAQDESHLFH